MNAFETELGLMPELAKAVDDYGWMLPTDIQGEAIPLILGGGDVLMAAETGSGKTGAFCLPVLQIVYESLCEGSKHAAIMASKGSSQTSSSTHVLSRLSIMDKTNDLAIDESIENAGLICQATNPRGWAGCRSTRGVCNGAKAYFECLVKDQGICRYGWSTQSASLDLGTDNLGFGFGGTGKKSFCRQFDSYGEAFTLGDRIGTCIDLGKGIISWSKNGRNFGPAYSLPEHLHNEVFFPTICMKNSITAVTFKGSNEHRPEPGYLFIDDLDSQYVYDSGSDPNSVVSRRIKAITTDSPKPNAPLCIVIEPSRELAEQTLLQFKNFKTHIVGKDSSVKTSESRQISELLLIGGVPVRQQIDVLQSQGAHIVVATPGRLEDFVSQKELELDRVRFFVLDELDGLLKAGYRDMICRLHKQIPQYTDKGRLQMIVCSATLHNFDVKKLAEQLMHFPSWIDLKGQDSVPDTVHHCVCYVDPLKDTCWRKLPRHVFADDDAVHRADGINLQGGQSKETLSQAVKMLKPLYVKNAIEKFKMDRCLIFCRTKLDCDNLERYFQKLGGGPRASSTHQFSCVCLHGDRNPQERKANLLAFKESRVRLLLCTDVAARGLDIAGLPYVINVMLPDDKSNYIHRIGRVGRAERMGLAISFCANVKEKVWYHSCPSKGKACNNTRLTTEGGCCIWYGEQMYLAEIEEHLGETITVVTPDLDIPVDEFQGRVVYGQKLAAQSQKGKYDDHVESLAPTVEQLEKLEFKSQSLFLELKQTIH